MFSIINLTRAILLATIFINGILAVYIFKKIYTQKNLIYKVLFIHLLANTSWAVFIFFNMYLPEITGQWTYIPGNMGYWFEKILFASVVVLLIAQMFFVKLFPANELPTKRWLYSFLGISSIIFIISLMDNTLFSKVEVQYDGWSKLDRGPFSSLYGLYTIICTFLPNFILYKKWKTYTNIILKTQIKILLTSYIIFQASGLLTNWILPVYFNISYFNAIGPAFSLILVAGMVYASTHYRFLDMRISLQKILTYTGTIGIMIFFLFEAFSHTSTVFSKFNLILLNTLTFLSSILLFIGLRKSLDYLFNLLLFKKTTNYLEYLRNAAKQINASKISLAEAIQRITHTISFSLNLQRCHFLFQTASPSSFAYQTPSFNGENNIVQLSSSNKIVHFLQKNKNDLLINDELTYSIAMESPSKDKTLVKKEMDKRNISAVIPIKDTKENIIALLVLYEKLSAHIFSTQEIKELTIFLEQMSLYINNMVKYMALKEEIEKHQYQFQKFTNGLFHEVRTPLTIASLSAQELSFVDSQEEKEKNIAKITRQIQKSSHILSDFFDILKLEQGNIKMNRSKIAVKTLIENALEKTKELQKKKKITIEWKNKKLLQTQVNVDVQLMTMMFFHLLYNAFYFNDKAEVKVELITKKQKKLLTVSIKDNGTGIPKKDLPHVFEKFYRVNQERTIAEGRTGLGLSYSKAVIEAHGGTIEIKSQIKKGTTVTVSLPL